MTKLKRVLGFPAVLLITINAIMGTGIYFLPSVGAKMAGPASILSWLMMSFIAIYIGMCFAELSSMFPKAGGVYEYGKQAYGRFASFIIGWVTLVAGNVTIAMLIVGGIQYLLPYPLPIAKTLLALGFIFIFNYIAYRGMRVSALMLMTFSIITIVIAISIIIPGFINFDPLNFKPFFVFPISSVFVTLFFIAETFFGWESAAFLAEETKNPEKVMPKTMITGTIAIAVIALLLVISAIGGVGWEVFGTFTAPLGDLGKAYFGGIGEYIFTLGIYIAIIGGFACWVVASPRLILALARDNLFLPQFAKIHPKFNTPYKAIILQTALTSILVIGVGGAYRALLSMLIPLAMFIYAAVLLGLVWLRFKKPKLKRPYKAPLGKILPIAMVGIMIALVVTWLTNEHTAWSSIKLGLSFIALGIPLYFLLEMYYDPRMIRETTNILAYLTLLTEKIFLPRNVRKEIIRLLGNVKGKTVLEFGCSVGTLTLHLAEEVGKNGTIYATDISEKSLNISRKRSEKKGHKQIIYFHDLKHGKRVHPDVPRVNVVASVATLGYVQDVDSVLKHMNKRLKTGSKICFVDYDKFFDLIPNMEWLAHDDKIKKVFMRSGFDVRVKRKWGILWQYIFIYGKKIRNSR